MVDDWVKGRAELVDVLFKVRGGGGGREGGGEGKRVAACVDVGGGTTIKRKLAGTRRMCTLK